MLHLGDITKINGYTAPIVDVVVGGSPCQDLSVAGKRAGLDGERSGLFMEQLRVIKEMRENDRRNGRSGESVRPRYMVWENVPGAFSSNKAEDFRIVLEELAKVKDPNAVVPMPEKWTNYGCIMGDGWSIAWRVLDAQFWGVPQRRRRIALVADFGGQSAPEILFIRNSVSGNTEQSQPKRKKAVSDATGSLGADDRLGADQYNAVILGDTVSTLGVNCGMSHGRQCVLEPQDVHGVAYTMQDREGKAGGGKGALIAEELSATLRAGFAQTLFQPVYSVENHPADSRVDIDESGKVQTLTSRMGTGGGNVPMVMALDRASFNQGKNAQYDFEVSDKGINSPLVAKGPSAVCYWDGGQTAGTLTANNASGCQRMPDKENFNCVIQGVNENTVAYCIGNGQAHDAQKPDKELCKTLNCMDDPMKICVAVDCRNALENDVNGALQSNMAHSLNGNNVVRTKYIVRRLTPLECERLQGYPDGWTDIGDWTDSKGKKRQTSDASRYKALGNSISLPNWKWILKRLCACYERDATLASLFDGISGFCLIWTQLNGPDSVKWTSEIEDFPIAVCKKHFGDEATGEKGDFYEAILGRNKTEDV